MKLLYASGVPELIPFFFTNWEPESFTLRAVLHADYVFDYIRWNHLYTVGITYSFHLSGNPQITSTHIGYLAGFIHSIIMH